MWLKELSMLSEFPVLTTLIVLPILGALALCFLKNDEKSNKYIKLITLGNTLVTMGLAFIVWLCFDPTTESMQFIEYKGKLGIDGYAILFILLTAFLTFTCVLVSWNSITSRLREYFICFLIMESLILGVFCSLDLLLFYIFFESVLIPMYIIIGIWGGSDKIYAAFKFFLYTLAGSVLFLLAIIYIYSKTGTTNIHELNELVPKFSFVEQKWLWLALLASFAVKVPMWPLHTWLPDAHVQAPTAGSVILAGILLKLGGYGLIRFSIPLLPEASYYFADFIFWMSIIAVLYTSFVALMQEDMKKLIAYSSVAHMGFVTAGLFSFNSQGIEGAIFQMLSHGLVSGALFMCVGVLYDRMHTKEIAFYSGLTQRMPKFALQFMVFMLASVGLPGTSGFVGEFMVLLGVFKFNKLFSTLLAIGIILGAMYMLWLYARVMFGEIKNKKLLKIQDINLVEKIAFWPITILIIFLGIYPNIILKDLHISTKVALHSYQQLNIFKVK